jgi:SNF2 family DNA or RNA helicase
LSDGRGGIAAEVDVYESQKMDYVISPDGDEGLLPEVCPDQRTVVFSQFNEPLSVMAERARRGGMRAVVLDGDTSPEISAEIKIDFDRTRCRENGREPKWDVLFANYKKGGVGLNLTDCTVTIALDEEWNPGKGFGDGNTEGEDHGQAGMRTWRIGQTEKTSIHVIRMEKSIDTWLASLIAEKNDDNQTFRNAMSREAFREAMEKGEL